MTNFRRYCEGIALVVIGLAFPLVLIAGEALVLIGERYRKGSRNGL